MNARHPFRRNLHQVLILFLITVLVQMPALAQPASGKRVDYRDYQSPVRHQQGRGTCTAFAIVAAMETFPGVPIDLSEQYVYAMAKMYHYEKMEEYTEGAPLGFYLDILKSFGTIREEEAPYNPNAPVWEEESSKFEAMKEDIQASLFDLLSIQDNSWKLRDNLITLEPRENASNPAWIKARLDEGVKAIPVGYAMSSKYWSQKSATEADMIDPSDFLLVEVDGKMMDYKIANLRKFGLNKSLVDGTIRAEYTNANFAAKEGHAVCIVGYNDRGFLIKNSWGEDWGESGYGWISYDYHEIFASEALIIRGIGFASLENCKGADPDPRYFHLKSTPHFYENTILGIRQTSAELSLVWTGPCAPKPVKAVEYLVYQNGKLLETQSGYVEGIFKDFGSKIGYPARVLANVISTSTGPFQVKVNVTNQDGTIFTREFSIIGRHCQEIN